MVWRLLNVIIVSSLNDRCVSGPNVRACLVLQQPRSLSLVLRDDGTAQPVWPCRTGSKINPFGAFNVSGAINAFASIEVSGAKPPV
jgi:hypothetical protein